MSRRSTGRLIRAGLALFGLNLVLAGCHPQRRDVASGGGNHSPGDARRTALRPAVKAAESEAEKDAPTGFKKCSLVLAKARAQKGFFDTYQKGDELYLAVPKKRLGELFLLNSRLAQGVGAEPLSSGHSIGEREVSLVSIERHGDRLYLIQRQTVAQAPAGTALAKAVEQAFGGSVLQAAAIESECPGDTLLIGIRNWVAGDLSTVNRLAAALTRSGGHGPLPTPHKERSFVESVKSFPDNLNIRARLTFTPSDVPDLLLVPDERFISITIHYTFARLPAEPMPSRIEDDRIGYLTTPRQELSSRAPDFAVRYINRWRLASGQAKDGLVRPRRPIVFYIDPSIPAEYRPFIKEGVESWQQAFTAAGWDQAIRAEPLPDGVDLEDLRYPCIRWDIGRSTIRGATSIVTDPRSGEILGASIRLSHNMVNGFQSREIFLVGGAKLSDAAGQLLGVGQELDGPDYELNLAGQSALLHASLVASGVLSPRDPMPLRLLGQGLKKTVMHEIGHALGLAHNFQASSTVPNERLADPEWVRTHGLGASIMDYFGINLPRGVAPAEWYYYMPVLGPSDLLSIAWGYGRDEAEVRKLARQAAQSGHRLGLFDNPASPITVDPTDQMWDLGSDPLTWAEERTEQVSALWQKLPEQVLSDGAAYGDLTDAMAVLLGEYARALRVALPYLGGQYTARDHVGDPESRPPYTQVPKGRQLQALSFLLDRALSERAFALPPELLLRLGPTPPRLTSGRRLPDVRPTERVRELQADLLGQLLSADTFSRIRSCETKYGADAGLSLPELFARVTAGVWSEIYAGAPANISSLRRDLQRRHLERLASLVLGRGDRELPADLFALSRAELVELKKRLVSHDKAAARLDAYSRAHLAESLSRITKLLDAQVHD